MSTIIAGVDIGGTKCAVCLGEVRDEDLRIRARIRFPTPSAPDQAIATIQAALDQLLADEEVRSPAAIGISCGSPLDSKRGLILAPPNLPGWEYVDIVGPLRDHFSVPVALQNDANAGALAEWRWGAGQGCRHLIFLTFGTGMGAGLILNGDLYIGATDMAGEVGHVRMEPSGPIGHGKAGSLEGYCSGAGIARLARTMAQQWRFEGRQSLLVSASIEIDSITAEQVGWAAQQGDQLAQEIFTIVGYQLGRGLAIIVDTLNPERIIIGGIYSRQQAFIEPMMLETLHQEALAQNLDACSVVPALLGEHVGDMASLAVALRIPQTLAVA